MQKTENKYQLTNEEINKILRRSPRSLSSSPGEQGLGAEQIKRYFYDFIYYMAERLNLSLGKIEEDVISLENGAIILRKEIEEELVRILQNHGEDTATHSDIREQLTSVAGLANRAFNLASGKSKVYVDKSFHMAILELQNENLNYGDFIMVLDEKSPDFVVVDFDNSDLNIIDIEIEDAHSGNLPDPTVGGMYRIKGLSKALLAIESGIDTSLLVSKSDVVNDANDDNADKIPTVAAVNNELNMLMGIIEETFAKKGETSSYEDKIIFNKTLEEDAVSIEIDEEDFPDLKAVRDLIIIFQIAKPTVSNASDNVLNITFNEHIAAAIGKNGSNSGGWAHSGHTLTGTLASFCVGNCRICIAPTTLGANKDILYTVGVSKNILPSAISSIIIAPTKAIDLAIPKGSYIRIVGRVAK